LEEKKFFSTVNELFRRFDGLKNKVDAMDRSFRREPVTYNPSKYVRGHKILSNNPIDKNVNINYGKKFTDVNSNITTTNTNNLNVNNNPPEKTNMTFSYEDYIKNRIPSKSTSEKSNKKPDDIGMSNNIDTFTFNSNFNNTQLNNKPNELDFQNVNNTFSNLNVTKEPHNINSSKLSNFGMNNQTTTGGNNEFSLLSNLDNNTIGKDSIMKKTTIVSAHDFVNDQQVQDSYNPYGQLKFNDFQPTTNFGNSMINRSQVPNNTNTLQPSMGYSQMNPNYPMNNSNLNFPNLQDVNRNKSYVGNNDLKFPK
jgi:hypothetical protein